MMGLRTDSQLTVSGSVQERAMNNNAKMQWFRVIVVFIVCLATVSLFFASRLFEDNYNYAIEQMHSYNNVWYANNINTVGSDFSPRLFANLSMSMLTHIAGGNWNNAAHFLVILNYILFAIAFTFITVKNLNSYRPLAGFIVTMAGMTGCLISLAFPLNAAYDVFLGTATPFALMAIMSALSDRPNWNFIWIMLAVSELMHVHEGLWGGFIVGVIWLADSFSNKRILWKCLRALPIYIASVLFVVLPSLVNSTPVDEALFTRIYVFIRVPHHLLVSHWNRHMVIFSGMLLLGALYVLFRTCKPSRSRNRTVIFASLLAAWVLLIAAEYVFTEKFSISAVATMYIPKALKYITFIAAVVYCKYGLAKIEEKNYLQGLALISILFLPYSKPGFAYAAVALLIIYAIIEKWDIDRKLFIQNADSSLKDICYLYAMLLAAWRIHPSGKLLLIVLLVFLLDYLVCQLRSDKLKKALSVYGILVLAVTAGTGVLYNITGGHRAAFISGDQFVKSAVGNSIWDLAKSFEQITGPDAMFLADPDDRAANAFQLVSHRSCYRLYKNMPSNKNSVIRWYQDIVKARKVIRGSAGELYDYMNDINLQYVLLKANRFDELAKSPHFELMLKNHDYVMFKRK